MLAAMNGHTAAVKLLLDMGSDINAQIETNRNTALTLACFQGRTEVVSLLLDRKANVEHRAKVRKILKFIVFTLRYCDKISKKIILKKENRFILEVMISLLSSLMQMRGHTFF
jgi:ankyrin repeat protein